MNLLSHIREAQVRSAPLDLVAPPGALLAALHRHDDPAVLESAAPHREFGRYSILACQPVEVLTLRDDLAYRQAGLASRSAGVLADSSGRVLAQGRRVWGALREAFACVRVPPGEPRSVGPSAAEVPAYTPGWIGYIGYEVGRLVEHLPGRAVRDTHLPDLRLAFYDALLLYDALSRSWQLVELEFADPPRGAGRAAEALRQVVSQAMPVCAGASSVRADGWEVEQSAPADCASARAMPAADATSNFTPEQYRRAVARCVEYIASGDVFQVCLSQRLAVHHAPSPLAIYRRLRSRNPAWYAAYLGFQSQGRPCAVLSSSPELFLSLRGRRVLTRPIKGTRRRTGDQVADIAAAEQLWASPKDNAELAMIVDLLRNDIGRVCRYGTVRVPQPRTLETHPTVFHLVATVAGELRGDLGAAELLRATFPGGSITGAPKIRAMQIIDELEGHARGVYTGCIGWVGVGGDAEWNIAIRTVTWDDGTAYTPVGGGVVADSDPAGEHQETLDKARAMLEAIELARRDEDV